MDLQTLIAKQEINEVYLRYCRGVDRCDKAALASVYHPDATVEHGTFRGKAEEFIPWILERISQDVAMTHSLSNIVIEIQGTKAACEAYFLGLFRNQRMSETLADHILGGRYLDHFEKRDGKWKKVQQVIVCDWSRLEPVKEESPLAEVFRKGKHSQHDFYYENRKWLKE